MDSFIKADVFFFVATVATIVVAVLFTVVIIYIILILKRIKMIVSLVKGTAELLTDDIKIIREELMTKGLSLRLLNRLIAQTFKHKKSK